MSALKADHQIRMIMAYRAAGARFYGAGTGNKWVRIGNKRFYQKHYRIACGIEKNLLKLRDRQVRRAVARQKFGYIKGILEYTAASPERLIARVKKALKR